MVLFWGGSAVLSQALGWPLDNLLLGGMYLVGGFSPTIASYVSLKRNKKVKNFKDWLKQVFDFKHSFWVYALVLLFVAVYYVLGCAINGFEYGAPIYTLIIILPLMLLGGGNEEPGWRMILQPELEKKYNFYLATIITAVIWWLWHLPLFFISGTAQSGLNYFLFGISCLVLSFALATIRKVSQGVFPCVLFHCLINGLSAVFIFNYSLTSCCLALVVTLIISVLVLKIIPKKATAQKNARRKNI